jgi:hypothetical protein
MVSKSRRTIWTNREKRGPSRLELLKMMAQLRQVPSAEPSPKTSQEDKNHRPTVEIR